jgi:hypothetical protein
MLLHAPVCELIRVTQIYADTWAEKHAALRDLEEEFKKQRRALDIAIRKLEVMKAQVCRAFERFAFCNSDP